MCPIRSGAAEGKTAGREAITKKRAHGKKMDQGRVCVKDEIREKKEREKEKEKKSRRKRRKKRMRKR
jgi:hypothetical protein